MLKLKAVSTTLTVDVDEFDDYQVATDDLITFALKEFKAIINLAKDLNNAVEAAYSVGGL